MKRAPDAAGGGISSETKTTGQEIPEHLRPREYGKKEIAPVKLRSLVLVSQQRGNTNPAFSKIKESIKKGDVINIPDVAYLRYEALDEYLRFINKIWGAAHDISEYKSDEDGFYHLVIAGHTRTEAMIELEDEKTYELLEAGYDIVGLPEPTVEAKIYRDLEPEEILALQMDENLHEKPSQERSAIAMVETFLYGIQIGKWTTKIDFVRANKGRFSQDALDKALLFCELDEVTRSFVFTGVVGYGPVVELAKTVQPHRAYLLKKYFGGQSYDDLDAADRQQIEEDITQWNASEIAFIQGRNNSKKKLNITAARKHFESYVADWEKDLEKDEREPRMFVDNTREWRDHRRKTRDKLRAQVKEISVLPVSGAFEALQLHVQVMGPDSDEGQEMLTLLDSGVKRFETKLRQVVAGSGALAVSSS